MSSESKKSAESSSSSNGLPDGLETTGAVLHDSPSKIENHEDALDVGANGGLSGAGSTISVAGGIASDIHYGCRGLILAQLVMLACLVLCLLGGTEYHSLHYKRLNRKQLHRLQRNTVNITEDIADVTKGAGRSPKGVISNSTFGRTSFFVRKGDKTPLSLFDPSSSILACVEHDILSLTQFLSFVKHYVFKLPMSIFFEAFKSTQAGDMVHAEQESIGQTISGADEVAYPVTLERHLLPEMKKHLSFTLNQHLRRYSASINDTCPIVPYVVSMFAGYDSIAFGGRQACLKRQPDFVAPSKLQLSFADLQNILNIHAEALRTLTGGLLYRAFNIYIYNDTNYIQSSHNVASAYDVPLLRQLNLFFHEGGFLSPCYPFNRILRRCLSGWYGFLPYALILFGWLPSLVSTHPITLVHFPRLTFYAAVSIYRALVLYTGGNILEYIFRSPYDYSDHVVLYMLFLLIASIEWSAVARTQIAGSPWILAVRVYYALVASSMLYMSLYTSMFFHDNVEVWLGFLVGFFGLFCVFWILVALETPSLSRIGILKGKRRESYYTRSISNDNRP